MLEPVASKEEEEIRIAVLLVRYGADRSVDSPGGILRCGFQEYK